MSEEPDFIFYPEIRRETGLSKTTIWRMEKEEPPLFPPHVNLSRRSKAWRRTQYKAWKANLEAQRRVPGEA